MQHSLESSEIVLWINVFYYNDYWWHHNVYIQIVEGPIEPNSNFL